MRLLLIEDDPMIGRAVSAGLASAGFSVDWVQDGPSADLSLAHGVYDVAILDLGLPQKDGMAVLRTLRARANPTPVLIATARDAVSDRIAGLNAGADDYVVKPFDLDELIARVRAVLRRHAAAAASVMVSGALSLDPIRKLVTWHDVPVQLSSREFALLETLMQRRGAVMSRKKLEESIYNWDDELGSNAVEVHVHKLRKKLGPDVIKNVRGVGYFVSDD